MHHQEVATVDDVEEVVVAVAAAAVGLGEYLVRPFQHSCQAHSNPVVGYLRQQVLLILHSPHS